ncbi:MAG: hypothetical protein ACYTGZ_10840, partial [Planctomycetota bacterium]
MPPPPPSDGSKAAQKPPAIESTTWTEWWRHCRAEYLDLESHLYAPTSSATGCFGFHDVPNAFRDAQRPMER